MLPMSKTTSELEVRNFEKEKVLLKNLDSHPNRNHNMNLNNNPYKLNTSRDAFLRNALDGREGDRWLDEEFTFLLKVTEMSTCCINECHQSV